MDKKWEIYQARIDYAKRRYPHDIHFVDYVADIALNAVEHKCDGENIGTWVHKKRIDYSRNKFSQETSIDAMVEAGFDIGNEDTPEDTEYLKELDTKINATCRQDAKELTRIVARMLIDGFNLSEIAIALNRPISRVHAAKMRLAAIV
jgi:hypothetical protein